MLTLRPYQLDLVERARQSMRAGQRRILLQSSTGSGKTCLTAHMLASAAAKGKRSWFCCHRRELVEQSVETFVVAADLHVGIVAAGYPSDIAAPVQVCSVASLARRMGSLPAPDLVVWDECFVADTIVGTRPIENIGVGSFVPCEDGTLDRVVSTFRKRAPDKLYRISAGGRTVTCTANHPFWTTRGWTSAAQLAEGGDSVYGLPRLRLPAEERRLAALFALLQDRAAQTQCRTDAGADSPLEQDGRSGSARESLGFAQANWSQAVVARWQRQARPDTATSISRRAWMALRICRENWRVARRWWPHQPLQDRHCQSVLQDRNRSRWALAWDAFASRAGFKKRGVFAWMRVDRVEVLERESDGEFERVCPDGFVYNLETQRTHTYLAHGFVVHNCQHLASKSWTDIAAALPNAVHVGLTATPQRLDGKGLRPYFDELLLGPTTAGLIEQGFLSRYQLYAPAMLDTSQLHTFAGDYSKREVADTMTASTVVGDAVSTYLRHMRGGEAVDAIESHAGTVDNSISMPGAAHPTNTPTGGRALVFAWSLEASRGLAAAFVAAGIPAQHVDGESPATERRAALAAFRRGDFRVLCNVDLFGEGLDVPAVDAVFLLRPTSSLSLYLQQVGRGLRTAEGKSSVKIFDHVGNWSRHGLPDDPRQWSLDGATKKPRESVQYGKRCPKCFAVASMGAKACPMCGAIYPVKQRKMERVDGELESLDLIKARNQARIHELECSCSTIEDWQSLAKTLGYKPYWGLMRFLHRKGQQRLRANS